MKLKIDDVDVVENVECFEVIFDQNLPHLYLRIECTIEARETLVLVSSVIGAGEASMEEGFAFEASKSGLILGITNARNKLVLDTEVPDHRIGPIRRDIVLNRVLLLLRGCGLHAVNYIINVFLLVQVINVSPCYLEVDCSDANFTII